MHEVEYKAHAPDASAVRDRLRSLEAHPLGACIEEDRYYAHPVRDFASTDEALRVRSTQAEPTGDRAPDAQGAAPLRMTYKGPRLPGATRARVEHEVGLDDDIDPILVALGFRVAGRVRKHRTSFRVAELTVTLDAVEGLGDFVEVEALASEGSVDAARERVLGLVAQLGLGAEETRSYLEMVLDGERAPRSSQGSM